MLVGLRLLRVSTAVVVLVGDLSVVDPAARRALVLEIGKVIGHVATVLERLELEGPGVISSKDCGVDFER